MEGLKDIFRIEVMERGRNILDGLEKGEWDAVLREIHTLKGTSRMMGFSQLGDDFQMIENTLKDVDVPEVEKRRIARRIGEAVSTGDIENLHQTLTAVLSKEGKEDKSLPKTTSVTIEDVIKLENLFKGILDTDNLEEIKKLAREGLLCVSSILLYPLKPVMETIIKRAREYADKLGKKVLFIISGENINVDKRIAEELIGPITHILNNAIDHGIETPEERLKNGKEETGVIEICFKKSGHMVTMEITDDGAGLDKEKIKRKGKEMGILIPPEELIFYDGLTTKEERGAISGMGVGLSSVRSSIKKIGGDIKVESEQGKFTRFTITVPILILTSRVFLFKLRDNIYAMEQHKLKRVFSKDEKFFMETKKGITIPFNRLLGIREVVIHDLPTGLKHPAYRGYFVYEGKPCLVVEPDDFATIGEPTLLTSQNHEVK